MTPAIPAPMTQTSASALPTALFALGVVSIQEFFAQLYAHPDLEFDPMSGGRAMNAHFGTRSLNPDGSWKDLTEQYNVSSDVSPTGAQMPRLVGHVVDSNALDDSTRFVTGQ